MTVWTANDAPPSGPPPAPATPGPGAAAPSGPSPGSRLLNGPGLAAAPAVLTFAVALIGIGSRQVWRDEHATWWAASLPYPGLMRLVESVDIVVLPYYLLMHGWVAAFGDSPTALRMPSAILMAVAAGLLALLGRRLFDAPTGLLAGLAFAVVPAVSRYAAEARPYAMVVTASVLAALLLLRALERPAWWRWLGYASAVAWIGFSHLVALLALAAHLLLVVLAARDGDRRRILLGWAAATLAGLGALVPMLLRATDQGSQISWIPDPNWQTVLRYPNDVLGSSAVAGILVLLGLAALVLGGRPAWFLGAWALVPPVLTYLTFDQFGFFFPRYLLFTAPAWVLLGAYGMRRLAAGDRRGSAVGLAVVLLGSLTFFGWERQQFVRSNQVEGEIAFQDTARWLRPQLRPGDAVVYDGPDFLARAMNYEFRSGERPADVLSAVPADATWSWTRTECADPSGCLDGVSRVWLLTADFDGKQKVLAGVGGRKGEALRERYGVGTVTYFHRIRIAELVLKKK